MVDVVTSYEEGGRILPLWADNALRASPMGGIAIGAGETTQSAYRAVTQGERFEFTPVGGLFGDFSLDLGGNATVEGRNPTTGNTRDVDVGNVVGAVTNAGDILDGVYGNRGTPNSQDSGLNLITAVIQNLDKIMLAIGFLFALQLLDPLFDLADLASD